MAMPAWGVTRAPRSLYVFDVHTGWSTTTGNYSAIGPFSWGGGSLTAAETFDPTYHFGITAGRLWNDHFLVAAGFTYTKINIDNQIGDLLMPLDTSMLRFGQYDFSLDANYYPISPIDQPLAPYFGGGVILGLTSWTPPGFRSESQFNVGLNLNFGVDLRVWKAKDGRGFVTLSSVNSANILATGDRPRFVNIGGAVKYFFRP
jgi:hypothetical protein